MFLKKLPSEGAYEFSGGETLTVDETVIKRFILNRELIVVAIANTNIKINLLFTSMQTAISESRLPIMDLSFMFAEPQIAILSSTIISFECT